MSKYLQSDYLSKHRRYKICIVCNNKTILRKILTKHFPYYKISSKDKRCGWVGFVYFDKFKEAMILRNKLYNKKNMYVFLQDDRPIILELAKS